MERYHIISRVTYIVENTVVGNFNTIQELYPESLILSAEEGSIGDEYNPLSGTFHPQTVEFTTTEKLEILAEKRWNTQILGIIWLSATYGPVWIATDAESRSNLASERTAAIDGLRDGNDVWKCGDPLTGEPRWLIIGNDEIEAIAVAARKYISACFRHESDLAAKISAGEDVNIEEDWPNTTYG